MTSLRCRSLSIIGTALILAPKPLPKDSAFSRAHQTHILVRTHQHIRKLRFGDNTPLPDDLSTFDEISYSSPLTLKSLRISHENNYHAKYFTRLSHQRIPMSAKIFASFVDLTFARRKQRILRFAFCVSLSCTVQPLCLCFSSAVNRRALGHTLTFISLP